MVYCLLLFFIFVSVYLLVSRLTILKESERFKKKGNFYFQTKESCFYNFISKINFIKTKDVFLSKQGYPLGLSVFKYFVLKVVLTFLFSVAALFNYRSIFISIVFGVVGYFLIDLYILINKKNRNTEICNDLYNVVNSICLQLSSNVLLKDALKRQYENCKNSDFKKAMVTFATRYELSELNIDDAIKSLNDSFDILELSLFCNALSEYNKTDNIIEILENLVVSLKSKQLDRIKASTRTKVLYITLGVIIALVNIILLIFYPLFISIGEGFNSIFS